MKDIKVRGLEPVRWRLEQELVRLKVPEQARWMAEGLILWMEQDWRKL